MNYLKTIGRKILTPIFYLLYLMKNKSLNKDAKGKTLMNGISAVISMKDEEYTIEACIRSLYGFADQIICIDNGSSDKSIEIVEELQQEFSHLELVQMPGALLGDCRNEGLKRTKYNWHLRWDADMIAHTDGEHSFLHLKNKILQSDTPRTIQLPRINLNGDFYHATEGKISDQGEPILMRYTRDIVYKEYGKFDSIKVPFYYKQLKESTNYYLHCQGLKSDENLIHRFHYFTWRKYTNENPNFKLSKDEFIVKRNNYYFGTNDPLNVNYRYQRQNVLRFVRYEPESYIDYPSELKKLMKENNRFEIVYKDSKPFMRIDKSNKAMQDFKPNNDDLTWSVDAFIKKIEKETINQYLN